MKRFFVLLIALSLQGCDNNVTFDMPIVLNPIRISSPAPTEYITKVDLTDRQKGYVAASNAFAFKSLKQLYDEESMIYSPLSLQMALAMTVNGASGETAEEITNTLGFGEDVNSLNEYCNSLLKQLPALDKDVDISLANSMIVKKDFTVNKDFKATLNGSYYAPVEYFNPKNTKEVVNRINEWASRNTKGFINPLLGDGDISPEFVAAIMNALYFKAKWAGTDYSPMFREEGTMKGQPFYLDGGGQAKVDLMRRSQNFSYAERDGWRIAAIPYASGKYAMYVLLPDDKGKQGLTDLIGKLQSESWEDIVASMDNVTKVNLRLPKFKLENKFYLNEAMQALGIKRAFLAGQADFGRMFDAPGWSFWIDKIIQKARINVAEWGTEAAAVTAVIMDGATSAGPGEKPREVDFFADHPFVYVIAEKTSGTILFEGVFTGK